jgi:pyruvate formate lyase activating enzyme
MVIGGFQRFSLLEYPGKIGAVLFTQGCNFRCPYCHNPNLVDPDKFETSISEDSIFNFLNLRKGKLEAVTISGGEPTIQPDILDFVYKIKDLGFSIKIDTNGSKPETIKELAKEGLVDYWAMDIKAPLSLYSVVCGTAIKENKILKSMDIIRNSGKEWEFRTTYFNKVLNWNDILEIQPMLKPGDKYYLQQCNYNNTLELLEDPHQSNIELVFNNEIAQKSSKPHHYSILNEAGKLQQIIIKMR